jgi:putative ABC transport system permease protein
MKSSPYRPPYWAIRFFRWFCNPDFVEDIEGDLVEKFYRVSETSGPSVARKFFIKEIILLFRPAIIRPMEGSIHLNQYGMFKNYVKTGFRNVLKSKIFSTINVVGLSLGLTCCMLIILYVSNELSFDTYHKNYDSIYRVLHTYRDSNNGVALPAPTAEEFQVWGSAPAGPAIQNEFPGVEKFFRFTSTIELLFEANGKRIQENEMIFADSTAFKVFSWRLLSGNPETALTEPNSIVLTYSTARKYFGESDPVGELITVDKTETFKVTGVMEDVPANSHFKFPGLISMTTFHTWRPDIFDSWGYVDFYTYLLIPNPQDAERVSEGIPSFTKKYLNDWESNSIALEPLSNAYLHSVAGRQPGETGNYNNIYLFSFIAIFILFVAVINYMNLSTARSVDRAKEIGIRKAIGASRSALVIQFLLETMMITCFSAILAIMLAQLLLPLLNNLSGRELKFVTLLTANNILIYTIATLALGILAGSYPAILLARYRPAQVLKKTPGRNTRKFQFRHVLVVFQFTISIALIAATSIVYNQLHYLQNHSLGLLKDHMLIIDFGWDNQVQKHIEQIKSRLTTIPGVQHVAASRAVPGDFLPNAGTQIESPEGTMIQFNPGIYEVDQDFVDHYQIELIAGRNFSDDFMSDTTQALLINEAGAKSFGYTNPEEAVGKRFNQWGREGKVVGVLRDFNYQSLHKKVEPLSIRYAPFYSLTKLSLRLEETATVETIKSIEREWSQLAPDRPFLYSFLDESFNQQYVKEQQFSKIFTSFAALSIFISCLGLLGLTIYTTGEREKEIGIRKVLGASVSNIVMLFTSDFIKLFIISFMVASPLTWVAMNNWLEDFAYHTDITFYTFVIAASISMAIALITIVTQSLRVATTNPIHALKNE